MTILLVVCSIILLTVFPNEAQSGLKLPERMDALAVAGFKAMYRHEFSEAESRFQAMTREMPSHPAGYIFLSGLYWWQFSLNFDAPSPELEKKFMETARKGIAVAKSWKKGGGQNVEADLWLGGGYGIIGRWQVSHYEFIRAYFNGRRAYRYLRSVVKRDPEQYEAYLGVGEFEYLASYLPTFIRLPVLLFVRGDRDGGFRSCRVAAEKARYGSTEAKIFLIAANSENEHDFKESLHWAQSLVRDDPDNRFFKIIQAMMLFYNKDYVNAEKGLRTELQALESDPSDPLQSQLLLVHYYLGTLSLVEKKYPEAIAWYTKAVELPESQGRGWASMCLLRRGQIRDVLGEREAAVKDYEAVLDRPRFGDSHRFAKKSLRIPMSPKELARQVFWGMSPVPEKESDKKILPVSSGTDTLRDLEDEGTVNQ